MSKSSYYTFLVIAVLLVAAGIFYYLSRPVSAPSTTPVDKSTSTVSGLPEGVSMVERDGEKYVRDERNKVEIEIEKDWKVNFVDTTTLSIGPERNLKDVSSEGVEVAKYSLDNNSLKNWLQNWKTNSNCPECYGDPVLVEDNVYKYVDNGSMGDIVNYFVQHKLDVFQITVFDSKANINDVLKRINFDL